MSVAFHQCHFSAFLIPTLIWFRYREAAKQGRKQSVTHCWPPGLAGRPEGYPLLLVTQSKARQTIRERGEELLALSSLASGVSRMASL